MYHSMAKPVTAADRALLTRLPVKANDMPAFFGSRFLMYMDLVQLERVSGEAQCLAAFRQAIGGAFPGLVQVFLEALGKSHSEVVAYLEVYVGTAERQWASMSLSAPMADIVDVLVGGRGGQGCLDYFRRRLDPVSPVHLTPVVQRIVAAVIAGQASWDTAEYEEDPEGVRARMRAVHRRAAPEPSPAAVGHDEARYLLLRKADLQRPCCLAHAVGSEPHLLQDCGFLAQNQYGSRTAEAVQAKLQSKGFALDYGLAHWLAERLQGGQRGKGARSGTAHAVSLPLTTGGGKGGGKGGQSSRQAGDGPGDWYCAVCNACNFADRTSCFRVRQPSGQRCSGRRDDVGVRVVGPQHGFGFQAAGTWDEVLKTKRKSEYNMKF